MEFNRVLKDLPTICLRGEEKSDQIREEINSVIHVLVDQLTIDLKLDDDIKAQKETRLLEMEHRTYLWLYLAIDSVLKVGALRTWP